MAGLGFDCQVAVALGVVPDKDVFNDTHEPRLDVVWLVFDIHLTPHIHEVIDVLTLGRSQARAVRIDVCKWIVGCNQRLIESAWRNEFGSSQE